MHVTWLDFFLKPSFNTERKARFLAHATSKSIYNYPIAVGLLANNYRLFIIVN